MTFETACRALHYAKSDIMVLAYGKLSVSIDPTVPSDYASAKGLSYHTRDMRRNLFFYATNCAGVTPIVEDMRTKIPAWVKTLVIALAEVREVCVRSDWLDDTSQAISDILDNYATKGETR